MIPLSTAASPVSMSAGVKSSNYTIALSGKTFDVLSSMLYKDPILAIIRELAVNGLDSHIINGNRDQPIDLHLPNTVEPHFSIRDYGTGMSAEQIDGVYTKFFESTKTTSNDVTGSLGLGSKSPFSYTSNYTITSWCGGLKLTYSAFKDATGIPSIALLDVCDSTEPTGLEVSFAVKSVDFHKFTEKVQTFFTTWCAVAPNITGGIEGRTTIRQVKRDFGGTDWFIASADGPLSTALAIQGNVPYPLQRYTLLESNTFRERFQAGNKRDLITRLLELPIIIEFPIGSLDFSASREELQYTEQTVAAILDRLMIIADEISTHIQEKATKCVTQWDFILFSKALRSDRLRYVVQLSTAGTLLWKGKKYSTQTEGVVPDYDKVKKALAIHSLALHANHRRKLDVIPLLVSTFADGVATQTLSTSWVISPSNTPTIVVIDEAKGSAAKIKHHYIQHIHSGYSSSASELLTIGVPRGEKMLSKVAFKLAVDQLLEALDVPGSGVKVVYASALTAPPAKQRAATAKVDDAFKIFTPSLEWRVSPSRYAQTCWGVTNIAAITDIEKSGKVDAVVYVPIARGFPMHVSTANAEWNSCDVYEGSFVDLWNNLRLVFGTKKILLVGIKTSAAQPARVKQFCNTHQSLDVYLQNWMTVNAKSISDTNARHMEWINHNGQGNIVIRALDGFVSTDPLVQSIVAKITLFKCEKSVQSTIAASRDLIQATIKVLRLCNRYDKKVDPLLDEISMHVTTSQKNAQTEYKALLDDVTNLGKLCPMLNYMNTHFRYSSYEQDIKLGCAHIRDYVKLALDSTQQP